MIAYHDKEWGKPVRDDVRLFEKLTLEGAQAGLSWATILKRREGYRKAFKKFDLKKISRFTDKDVERLLQDTGIIRNRLKVLSVINNARVVLEIQKEYGSFEEYIWGLAGGKVKKNRFRACKEIPATTPVSDLMSKALKKRGFKFIGPTCCYAFMQGVGMVNDHTVGCFRYDEV